MSILYNRGQVAIGVESRLALDAPGRTDGYSYDAGGNLGAEASWTTTDMCVHAHVGFGFSGEWDIDRRFCEARLSVVAPLRTDSILSYLAEHVLRLPGRN